jgi:arsenite methyltransferase
MSESIPLSAREDLRDLVRERYAETARNVINVTPESSGCCNPINQGPALANAYAADELGSLPQTAVLASLGCGNPTALAELHTGETVLDLGSGGGIDVLLSAKRVGPEGFVYGLDMTDEMLEMAERNRAEAGIDNVQFLKGHIEAIPLPENSVDVIISNCVINLSGDKDRVLREAHRVLNPGGRFAVSDMVVSGEMPQQVLNDLAAWSCCVAGALSVDSFRSRLATAGFTDIDIEITHDYEVKQLFEDSADCCGGPGLGQREYDELQGKVHSAFIRARKPE